jgi:hypothetical protein
MSSLSPWPDLIHSMDPGCRTSSQPWMRLHREFSVRKGLETYQHPHSSRHVLCLGRSGSVRARY